MSSFLFGPVPARKECKRTAPNHSNFQSKQTEIFSSELSRQSEKTGTFIYKTLETRKNVQTVFRAYWRLDFPGRQRWGKNKKLWKAMQCEEIKQSAESPTLGPKFVLLFSFLANVTWKMRLLFAKNAGTLHGSPSLSENQSEKLYPQDILFFSFSVQPKGWWCWSSCTKFPFNVFAQSIKRQTTIEYRKVVKQSWERSSGVSMNITLKLRSLFTPGENSN